MKNNSYYLFDFVFDCHAQLAQLGIAFSVSGAFVDTSIKSWIKLLLKKKKIVDDVHAHI